MFKIVTIPFDRKTNGFDEEALTKFVLNKRIKSCQPEFFQDGGDNYWTVFLEYDPLVEVTSKAESERLDDPQRILLERLKAWRKERAEKDGVPVYIVGTNKELIDIVSSTPKSLEALKNIKGFGKSKISKYGKEIIDIIKAFFEKS